MVKDLDVDYDSVSESGNPEDNIDTKCPGIKNRDIHLPIKHTDYCTCTGEERTLRAQWQARQNCAVVCLTFIMICFCFVAFVFCPNCLFAILIISACMCPFFHPMNAPLWLAIVLLTVGGWNFTMGALTVSWKYKE